MATEKPASPELTRAVQAERHDIRRLQDLIDDARERILETRALCEQSQKRRAHRAPWSGGDAPSED